METDAKTRSQPPGQNQLRLSLSKPTILVKHGLILSKIHRVILFDQKAWLEPWIAYCTERRKMARDEFESDLAKLQANATFGKTIKQVRHRVNVPLICDPINLLRR